MDMYTNTLQYEICLHIHIHRKYACYIPRKSSEVWIFVKGHVQGTAGTAPGSFGILGCFGAPKEATDQIRGMSHRIANSGVTLESKSMRQ